MYMLWAIPTGCIPIAPAAVGIVTARGLVEALTHTPADVAILVPSVVADLAQNPDQLVICAKHLSLILYIGGDLPQAIGALSRERYRCAAGGVLPKITTGDIFVSTPQSVLHSTQ